MALPAAGGGDDLLGGGAMTSPGYYKRGWPQAYDAGYREGAKHLAEAERLLGDLASAVLLLVTGNEAPGLTTAFNAVQAFFDIKAAEPSPEEPEGYAVGG